MVYRFSITSFIDKAGAVMAGSRVRRSAAALLEVVLVGAILVVAVMGVVRPLLGPGVLEIGTGRVFGQYPSVEATLDPSRVRIETDPVLPSLAGRGEVSQGDGLEVYLPTRTSVAVHDPNLRQLLGLVGSEVLEGAVAVVVLVLLLLLVRSLRRGDPFVPANARRLYAIAAVVGVGGQAAVLLAAWGRQAVLEHPSVSPYVFDDFSVTWMPLLAGLGVAVAAEVFRQGAELRAEVDGLV